MRVNLYLSETAKPETLRSECSVEPLQLVSSI